MRTCCYDSHSTDQCLDHGRPLNAQVFHRLEHVNHSLRQHPLQNDVQRYEHSRAANTIAEGNIVQLEMTAL